MLVNTQLRRKLLFESDLAKHGKSQAEPTWLEPLSSTTMLAYSTG